MSAGTTDPRLRRVEEILAGGSPGAGDLDAVLPRMVRRLRPALDADFLAVLLTDDRDEGQVLVVRAADGSRQPGDVGTAVPLGAGLAGRAAATGAAVEADTAGAGELVIPTLASGRLRVTRAAPMRWGDTLTGVLVTGHAQPAGDGDDLALLEIAAKQLALAIETLRTREDRRRASLGAERARQHLRMLGDASRALMRSTGDYEQPLREALATVPDDFASLAAIFLADGSGDQALRLAACRPPDAVGALAGADLTAIRNAMSAGQPRLVVPALRPDGDDTDAVRAAMTAAGIHSYVIAPIRVRGLAFGALLLGTGPGLRGYREADRRAIDDLAGRIALAIEGNLLYREAQASAAANARSLERLRTLVDMRLRISGAPHRHGVLRGAAEGARRLFPDATVVVADTSGQYDATGPLIPPPLPWKVVTGSFTSGETLIDQLPTDPAPGIPEVFGDHWMLVPLVPEHGEPALLAVIGLNAQVTGEDESLLTLLARMTSTALANQALLDRVSATAARLEAVLDASPAAIIGVNGHGEVVDCNATARRMLGWPDHGLHRLPPALAELLPSLVLQASARDAPQQRAVMADIDGSPRHLIVMLAPVGGNEPTSYVLVATDDTERWRLEREFQQAQRMEAVGRLAGGVAHDFNNLLTVILGFADGLLRRLDADDPTRARVEAIHRAGRRGAELTRQLLTISRQQVTTPVVLHPTEVIDDLLEMLQRLVGEGVRVLREPGGEDIKVRIDRLQLEQVLFNLAANSRDAMPDGGEVLIAMRRREGVAELRVTDYGTGMDEDTLNRCLDPLFTTKGPGEGTGLGLSSVYGIARQNGGDVRIDSAPGLGTTVRVLLPESQAEETDVAGDEPTAGQRSGRSILGTILVVDDEPEICRLVRRILADAGHRVRVATSAHEARQRFDADVDLLLTDVAMPGTNGVELARTLLAIREVPVVFMSGYAEHLSAAATSDAASQFLAKPFTAADLEAAVSRALASGRQGSNR